MDIEFGYRIPPEAIEEDNRPRAEDLERDLDGLRESLRRSGLLERLSTDLEGIIEAIAREDLALASRALASAGGSGFPGRPLGIIDRLVDAATVHDLTGAAPRVALDLPADRTADPKALLDVARRLGIGFEAVAVGEDRTVAGLPGLAHPDPPVRAQAVEEILDAADFGKALGAGAAVVRIDVGRPGGALLRRPMVRVEACLREAAADLPEGWRLLIAPSGPACGSRGQALAAAAGERAAALIGPPRTGIEAEVAALIAAGKFGGVRLDAADRHAASPAALFLVLTEVADAQGDSEVDQWALRPVWIADRSDVPRDPIEDLLEEIEWFQATVARALLVDRPALRKLQERGDRVGTERVLRDARETDVRPIVGAVRVRKGAAIDPLAAYRRARYRDEKARERRTGP